MPIQADLGPDQTIEQVATPLPSAKTAGALVKALLGRGGMLALDSITGILCARLLKPQGRGELAAVILWPVFLSGAFTLGVPSAIIYTLRKAKREAGALIAAAILLSGGMSVVTALTGVLLLPLWLSHYSLAMVRQAQWFMLAAPMSMAVLIFRGIWESYGGFGKSATSQLVTRLITLSALLVLAFTHHITATTAAFSYVLGGIPAFLWMGFMIVPKAVWKLRQVTAAARELLSYGLRSYGIDLCGALSQYIDQALVLGMLSASAMGTYTVALSLSRMLNVIAVSISAVLFPKAVGVTPERAVRMAIRAQIGTLALATVGASFMLAFASFALNLLYGHEYLIATKPLKILTIEAVLSGSITVMSQPFMAMGRPGVVTLLQVAGLATSVPLIMLLVPSQGSTGASEALVCSALLRAGLLAVCYARILPGVVPWRSAIAAEAGNVARAAAATLKNRLGARTAS